MHKYRTHKCHELSLKNVNETVRLSGWIHRKRDHGQLIFLDLRDHYGLTQVVIDSSNKNFSVAESLSLESVITITGMVVERSEDTINKKLPSGYIEVNLSELEIISKSSTLPLQVNSDEDYGEETRLKFRYLDFRRNKLHENIILRSKVISYYQK
jgi:aspartyl-tRNA synthetase